MNYGTIPYVAKPVSRIFYGIANPIFIEGGDGSHLIEAALEMGINAFDMARQYGLAETSFGNWLKKNNDRREEIVILSKCAHPLPDGTKRVTPEAIREEIEETLKELHTDYVDIYLPHRDDPEVEVGPIVEVLNELHAAGKIGAFGGSNWTVERIEAANAYAREHDMVPFTVSSPNYGLAEQVTDLWGGGCIGISGPKETKARNWYIDNQMPVIAYSSLGRGLLGGRLKSSDVDHVEEYLDEFAIKGYCSPENFERLRRCEELAAAKNVGVSQIALAYIFHTKVNTYAIMGSTNPERIRYNIDSLSVSLTEEECKYLNLE